MRASPDRFRIASDSGRDRAGCRLLLFGSKLLFGPKDMDVYMAGSGGGGNVVAV
jgi:hypothetical protein